MAQKAMSLTQWAMTVPAPRDADRELEWQFLTGHWHYGGRIHEEVAHSLIRTLDEPSEMAVGHNLFLRLFSEYATALETLGAWGWTFRNYRNHKLFLDAFLTYPPAAPREFYRAVRRNRSSSLALLLKLPRRKALSTALADNLDLTESEFAEMASECMSNLRLAADQYFGGKEIIRTTYNKAKHGATIVRTPDLGPRNFYVLGPHLLLRGKRDRARYDLTKFAVDKTRIRQVERGLIGTGLCIRFLAGIARGLVATGRLYPQ